VPAHPATKSTVERVRAIESKLDVAALAADLAERAEKIEVE